MRKPIIWVLLADGQRARLLQTNGRNAPLVQATDREFIGNAEPSRDIASDRPGRGHDRGGAGRHAMDPPTDPHRYEKKRFVRSVVDELDERRKKNEFEQLVIVAPPKALGDIRAELSDGLKDMLKAELNKDLTKVPIHELPEYLAEVL